MFRNKNELIGQPKIFKYYAANIHQKLNNCQTVHEAQTTVGIGTFKSATTWSAGVLGRGIYRSNIEGQGYSFFLEYLT